MPINIPALWERREEIPPLLHYYLDRFNVRYERQVQWSLEALDLMCDYAWPGNIRELINIVERLVVTNQNGTIEALDLPEEILNINPQPPMSAAFRCAKCWKTLNTQRLARRCRCTRPPEWPPRRWA